MDMKITVSNPFFADLNDDTNPFKDSTIFRPGLTINDIPPRPAYPSRVPRYSGPDYSPVSNLLSEIAKQP